MATKVIDLRSDTVTLPSPTMREAMYRAELGDDVFRDDPTVIKLEEMAAERLGKEAALLLSSGTQGNLVGVLAHCRRGDEVIVGDLAHLFTAELVGCVALGGLQLRTVPNGTGVPDPAVVEAAIRPPGIYSPRTSLICLENTHNRCGGVVLSAEDMGQTTSVARHHAIPVHVDGARFFNAAVALGVTASDLARELDSVSFCLSKGLACPVGSLLCGRSDYIERARRFRKMVGGGMRQAGVIAAAGIVALETMVDRLAEDHENARILAEGLAEFPGVSVESQKYRSNLVFFELGPKAPSAADLVARMAIEGVRFGGAGRRCRMVTHYGITTEDTKLALAAMRRVLAAWHTEDTDD